LYIQDGRLIYGITPNHSLAIQTGKKHPLRYQGTAQIKAKAAQRGFYHRQGVWLRVNLHFYGKYLLTSLLFLTAFLLKTLNCLYYHVVAMVGNGSGSLFGGFSCDTVPISSHLNPLPYVQSTSFFARAPTDRCAQSEAA
jgi:hypothetical protein